MGNTHWDDLSGKKRWRKAKNDKHNELFAIAQKYHLTKDTKPAYIAESDPYFEYLSFEYDAKNYADSKYAHTAYVSGWSGKIISVTLTILIAVVSVLGAPVSGGSSTILGAALAGSVSTAFVVGAVAVNVTLSLIAHSVLTGVQNKSNAKKIQEGIENYRASASNFKAQAKERSAELTTLMVYGKYEIYANGSIYNHGRAGTSLGGDNSYSPSEAYDPTRGMRGDLARDRQVDDMISYRAHTALGGNKDFMQKTLGVDFPLAQSGFNYAQNAEQTQKSLDTRLAEINEGFGALIDAGAGLEFTHKVEYTSNPAKAYKDIMDIEMGFFKNKLYLNDCIQKSEYYKNGLWAEFGYLYFKDQATQRESAMANIIELTNEWDSKESQAIRAQMSDEELLKVCIEMMSYSLDAASEYLASGVMEGKPLPLGLYKEIGKDTSLANSINIESAKSAYDVFVASKRLKGYIDFALSHGGMLDITYVFFKDASKFIYTKEQVSREFLQSLGKFFWDSRLNSLDLRTFSLEALGLSNTF